MEVIKKACMFVLNPCTNDARVIKEANTLGRAGYEIKVIAIFNDTCNLIEKKENFTIYRVRTTGILSYIKFKLRFIFLSSASTPLRTKKNNVNNNIKFVCIRRLSYYFSYWIKAKRLAEKFRADIYHAHDLNTLLPAYLAAKKTGAKVVYDSHELFTERQSWGTIEKFFYTKLEAFLIKRVDKIITVNCSIADELIKRYNISPPNIIINCPPSIKHKVTSSSNNLLRSYTGIPNQKKLILYQGGFSSHRGLEELIESFEYLNDDYCLVLMGYGEIQNELEDLVDQRGFRGRIKFLPAVSQEVLLEYTSCADLGVIPYKPVSLNNYYTLPNKLFEYINAFIPVVGSDVPELRRVIMENSIGLLFNPENPRSIAESIEQVMANHDRYAEMKKNTIKVAKVYNWGNESRKLLALYNNI
jgi:glycosyltransferase involved in cell wall biosynthesis